MPEKIADNVLVVPVYDEEAPPHFFVDVYADGGLEILGPFDDEKEARRFGELALTDGADSFEVWGG